MQKALKRMLKNVGFILQSVEEGQKRPGVSRYRAPAVSVRDRAEWRQVSFGAKVPDCCLGVRPCTSHSGYLNLS